MNGQRGKLHILMVSGLYPSAASPQAGTFVKAVAREFARVGAGVSVVAPVPLRPARMDATHRGWVGDDFGVRVARPRFLSLSNIVVGPFSTFRWTVRNFARAASKAVDGLGLHPSVVYGHFLYPGGHAALRLASRLGVPAVVALGESSLDYYVTHLGLPELRREIAQFRGILSVSEQNKRFVVERLGLPEQRVFVQANAADPELFQPRDRGEMRVRLGLPRDRLIVAFVGHLNERKGPLRLLRALQGHPEVGAFFLGEGPQVPTGAQVLHVGRVGHETIPEWLSAADLFVLPTLAEGSPNVVAEALACGLPVVASDLPAIREMVGREAGVLVDPLDEAAIAGAIRHILESEPRRHAMSRAALLRARAFTLQDRCGRILRWLEGIIRPEQP